MLFKWECFLLVLIKESHPHDGRNNFRACPSKTCDHLHHRMKNSSGVEETHTEKKSFMQKELGKIIEIAAMLSWNHVSARFIVDGVK